MSRAKQSGATLARIQADPRVSDVSIEGPDGVFVYLKPGYSSDNPGEHAIHGNTLTTALRDLKLVQPCTCQDCGPTAEEILDGLVEWFQHEHPVALHAGATLFDDDLTIRDALLKYRARRGGKR